jgi:hypothetical protein
VGDERRLGYIPRDDYAPTVLVALEAVGEGLPLGLGLGQVRLDGRGDMCRALGKPKSLKDVGLPERAAQGIRDAETKGDTVLGECGHAQLAAGGLVLGAYDVPFRGSGFPPVLQPFIMRGVTVGLQVELGAPPCPGAEGDTDLAVLQVRFPPGQLGFQDPQTALLLVQPGPVLCLFELGDDFASLERLYKN